MICLVAGTLKDAQKWAKSQNLRDDEWFWPATLFDIVRRKNFHTIMVVEGIDHITNDHLNRILVAAWEYGRKK